MHSSAGLSKHSIRFSLNAKCGRVVLLLSVSVLLIASTGYGEFDPQDGLEISPLRVDGRHIVNAEGEIVLLRGATMGDLRYKDSIGEPILFRDMLMLKEWGGNVVVIEIAPLYYTMLGEEEYLRTHVDHIVEWAGELGLYAIIMWKAHGNPLTGTSAGYEHLQSNVDDSETALLEISRRYQDCGWVLYQVWNENPPMSWLQFRRAMRTLVDAVRSNSPEAIVIVPGTHIATEIRPIANLPVERENIVYASDIYQGAWYGKPEWRDDAVYLLESGYPLIIAEWGFGYQGVGLNHTSTPEDFGWPFVQFCDEHGISWIATSWTHRFEIPMFYDYERTQLTPMGHVAQQALAEESGWIGTESAPPHLDVVPEAAAQLGCQAIDVLEGQYSGIPSTIVQAVPAFPYVFDHWEGDVDFPQRELASIDLRSDGRATAVFRTIDCAYTIDDFAESSSTSGRTGGEPTYGWDSHNHHHPGDDPTADAVIDFDPPQQAMVVSFSHESWLKIYAQLDDLDVAGYTGILIDLSASCDMQVEFEISGNVGGQWVGYTCPLVQVRTSLRRILLPFRSFTPYSDSTIQAPSEDIAYIRALAFFPRSDTGTITISRIGLYRDEEKD